MQIAALLITLTASGSVFWDSQVTVQDFDHGTTYIDDEGGAWFLKDLVREDVCDECREAPPARDASEGAAQRVLAIARKRAFWTGGLTLQA